MGWWDHKQTWNCLAVTQVRLRGRKSTVTLKNHSNHGKHSHSAINTCPIISWILRNSQLLQLAGVMGKLSLCSRAVSPVSSLHFGKWRLARQAASLEVQAMKQLPAPHFTVSGKRQDTRGGMKLSVSKGHVAHSSLLSKVPAASNEVTVISCVLGYCRAEWEHSCQHMWEGAMLVP